MWLSGVSEIYVMARDRTVTCCFIGAGLLKDHPKAQAKNCSHFPPGLLRGLVA